MTLLGNPTRKRGIGCIFLAYASGYQVFEQHQFVLAALLVGCAATFDEFSDCRQGLIDKRILRNQLVSKIVAPNASRSFAYI